MGINSPYLRSVLGRIFSFFLRSEEKGTRAWLTIRFVLKIGEMAMMLNVITITITISLLAGLHLAMIVK